MTVFIIASSVVQIRGRSCELYSFPSVSRNTVRHVCVDLVRHSVDHSKWRETDTTTISHDILYGLTAANSVNRIRH